MEGALRIYKQTRDYGYVTALMVRVRQRRQAVNTRTRNGRLTPRRRQRAIRVLKAWASRATSPRDRLDMIRRRRT